jgi:hypothetical protein
MWTLDITRVSCGSFSSRSTNYQRFTRNWHLERNGIDWFDQLRGLTKSGVSRAHCVSRNRILFALPYFHLFLTFHNPNSLPTGPGTSVFGLPSLRLSECFCSSRVILRFNLLIWRSAKVGFTSIIVFLLTNSAMPSHHFEASIHRGTVFD